jgi:hypothetical protein
VLTEIFLRIKKLQNILEGQKSKFMNFMDTNYLLNPYKYISTTTTTTTTINMVVEGGGQRRTVSVDHIEAPEVNISKMWSSDHFSNNGKQSIEKGDIRRWARDASVDVFRFLLFFLIFTKLIIILF